MAKITRSTQKVFGDAVGATGNFGKFGSLAAGTPQYSKDLAEIQSLDAWTLGWAGAVVGLKSPALEDMNSLFYTAFKQLAYLLQQGVPEWDAGTTYYVDQFVSNSGKIYKSKTNNNLNNPVTDTNNWIEYVSSVLSLPAITLEKTYIYANPQQLVNRNTVAPGWNSLDLAPQIAAAGLNAPGITVRAAIMSAEIQLGAIGFSQATADAGVWVGGDGSGNPVRAYVFLVTDDSDAAAHGSGSGNVLLANGHTAYYTMFNNGRSGGLQGSVFLNGFIYNQTVQL